MNTVMAEIFHNALQTLVAAGLGDQPLFNQEANTTCHNHRTGKHRHVAVLFPDGVYRAPYQEQDGPSRPWVVDGTWDDLAYADACRYRARYTRHTTVSEELDAIERQRDALENPHMWEHTRDNRLSGYFVIGRSYRRIDDPTKTYDSNFYVCNSTARKCNWRSAERYIRSGCDAKSDNAAETPRNWEELEAAAQRRAYDARLKIQDQRVTKRARWLVPKDATSVGLVKPTEDKATVTVDYYDRTGGLHTEAVPRALFGALGAFI